MKPGYKQTEIGMIPEEWDVKEFGKVGNYYKGSGISMRDVRPIGLPCIMYGDIYVKFDTSFKECDYRIDSTTAKNSVKASPQDLFFTASGETADDIGRCVSYQGKDDIYIGGDIIALHPSDQYDSLFLSYVQNSENVKKQKASFAQGHSVVHISVENIKKTIFASPNYAEQRRIAEALSDVDELIASLEKLIEKKKALKQGVMQELLTGKRRLPGFSGEWESVNLEQIGVLSGSGVDKKVLPDEKTITLLNYTNVYHQTAISRKDLAHQVTASDRKITECSVKKYDVFLTPTSETPDEIAFSAVAVEDMPDVVYSYHVVRLRPYDSFNGAYINYAMNTEVFRNQATMLAEGSGIRYVITLKKFRDMVIMVPCDLNEQNAIVQVLFDYENEIDKLTQKLDKVRSIKSGMMSELLTGKIRLV